jgi:hypothetical protein
MSRLILSMGTVAVAATILVAMAGCSDPSTTSGASPAASPGRTSALPTSSPRTAAPAGGASAATKATTGTAPTLGSHPAATIVPQPTPGDINKTVAPRKVVTRRPVRLNQTSQVTGTVRVRIPSVKAIQAQARLPGEVAGPGVAITVTVNNGSAKAIDLTNVVVTLTDSAQNPGGAMTDARARPFRGSLAAGQVRTGVYVFTVAKNRRDPVTVTVTLEGDSPVVEFRGAVR